MFEPRCCFLDENGIPCQNPATCAALVSELGLHIPACDTHKEGRQFQEAE